MLKRANELAPGDLLAATQERVVRAFVDKMTDRGYINVTLLKPSGATRTARYKIGRRIEIIG